MVGIIRIYMRKTVLNVLTGSKTFMGIHRNRNVPSGIIPRRADVTTCLCDITSVQFSSVQSLSHVQLFATP